MPFKKNKYQYILNAILRELHCFFDTYSFDLQDEIKFFLQRKYFTF